MKKVVLIGGSLFLACLMTSVVTAVPQANSIPAMNLIDDIERCREHLNEPMMKGSVHNLLSKGIIDLIRQIILLIINFVLKLIQIVRDLLNLVNLVEYLINLIVTLITAIFNLIQAIINLFTPGVNTV